MMKKRKNKILLIAIISLIAIICALIYNAFNKQVDLNRTELLGIDDTQAEIDNSYLAKNSLEKDNVITYGTKK